MSAIQAEGDQLITGEVHFLTKRETVSASITELDAQGYAVVKIDNTSLGAIDLHGASIPEDNNFTTVRQLILFNASSSPTQTIIIKNNSITADAGKRFFSVLGTDITLNQYQFARFGYIEEAGRTGYQQG